ncbi:MAG: hypothetical protein ACRDRX_01295 [Pseudonocardiaceae bacterium]
MTRIKWGLSVLDFRRHAVDECAEHPIGVYKAQCGHLLMMVTPLLAAPVSSRCEVCAAVQSGRARAAERSTRARAGGVGPGASLRFVGGC